MGAGALGGGGSGRGSFVITEPVDGEESICVSSLRSSSASSVALGTFERKSTSSDDRAMEFLGLELLDRIELLVREIRLKNLDTADGAATGGVAGRCSD